MPSIPTVAISSQGAFLFFNGLFTLLFPSIISAEDSPLVGTPHGALTAQGLSSISLGLSYLLIVRNGGRIVKEFLILSVPVRLLAGVLFWRHGNAWKGVVALEVVMGIVNLGCLALV